MNCKEPASNKLLKEQKLEEFRQFWINGIKDGDKDIQKCVAEMNVWQSGEINTTVTIITEEECIEIFIYHCKCGKTFKDDGMIDVLKNIHTRKGIFIAYKRMILECSREFVEKYLQLIGISRKCNRILVLALIETKWHNNLDICRLDKLCNSHEPYYVNKMLVYILDMELKLSLLYFLRNYEISKIEEPHVDIKYPFLAAILLYIFSNKDFLYQPMIHLCLDLCKENETFLEQLANNLYNVTQLTIFKINERNVSKPFIWFLIEIDLLEYLPKGPIERNIDQYYDYDKRDPDFNWYNCVLYKSIVDEYKDGKNKIDNIVDTVLHSVTKVVIIVIKEYIVYYESFIDHAG